MRQHLLALLLLLALTLSLPALAGAIPTPKPAATDAPAAEQSAAAPKAPSFGVFKGVEDALISQMPDGSLSYLYTSVDQASYEAFGEMLEAKYQILEDTIQYDDYAVSFTMTDAAGVLSFTLSYDGQKGWLTMLYPAGTQVEELSVHDPFAGRLEVVLGQKLKTGFGTVSIDEIHLMDGSSVRVNFSRGSFYSPYAAITVPPVQNYTCWIGGSVENKQKSSLSYSSLFSSCTLHYVNLTDDYAYEKADIYGGFNDFSNLLITKTLTTGYGGSYFAAPAARTSLASLSSSRYVCCLSTAIPEAAVRATDGILAVTFTLNGVDCVLYLRK